MFAIPGNAQAKIEDVSRLLLSGVSQSTSLLGQVSGSGRPSTTLAGVGQKLAVSAFTVVFFFCSPTCTCCWCNTINVVYYIFSCGFKL